MSDSSSLLILSLGLLLLLGLATDLLGKRTALPRATLLVLLGLVMGPAVLDLIPELLTRNFDLVADLALVMIGFLIGGRLTLDSFRSTRTLVLTISLAGALGTTLLVGPVLWWIGLPVSLAILLGCIAAATDPAATLDVIHERRDDSPLARTLVGVVALDDAWGMIIFSLGLSLVAVLNGNGGGPDALLHLLRDIGGGLLLGGLLGYPAALLTGRIRPGEPMLMEAVGLMFVCGGLAMVLEVSFLIAAMVMGAVIANCARHHEYPFHEIEGIEGAFMAIFFILAGASLDLQGLQQAGLFGLAYILVRSLGKVTGSWAGALLAGREACNRVPGSRAIGAAMLPQAGAAIGMALVVADTYSEHRQLILAIVIGSTVVFELLAPLITRQILAGTNQSPREH